MHSPTKLKKFKTGVSRYCQSCGKESENLFQVTKETQTVNQLQYCAVCRDSHQKISIG